MRLDVFYYKYLKGIPFFSARGGGHKVEKTNFSSCHCNFSKLIRSIPDIIELYLIWKKLNLYR